MILGIGIDLVSIQMIDERVSDEAFRRKVFTSGEIAICETYASSAEHYAGKFAAKEALMKSIGRGIRQEVWFTQIEVLNNAQGMPYIVLSGEADRVMKELKAEKIHLTLTHSTGMALALVILESG